MAKTENTERIVKHLGDEYRINDEGIAFYSCNEDGEWEIQSSVWWAKDKSIEIVSAFASFLKPEDKVKLANELVDSVDFNELPEEELK